MRRVIMSLGIVLTVLLNSGCGPAEESTPTTGSIVSSDGWVRATTDTEDPSMTGVFMQLTNEGESAVTLVGASSEVAAMTQLHTMQMQDGQMAMVEAPDGFTIEPGKTLTLAPGGDHIMLMDLSRDLNAGDEVTLTLTFDNESTVKEILPVKEFTEETGHYHPSTSPSK